MIYILKKKALKIGQIKVRSEIEKQIESRYKIPISQGTLNERNNNFPLIDFKKYFKRTNKNTIEE